MKLFLSIILTMLLPNAALGQEFSFLDPENDELVIWSFENGLERRIDLSIDQCGGNSTRRLIGTFNNPVDGIVGFRTGECAQNGDGLSGNEEHWFVNTLTGEIEIGRLDPRLAELSPQILQRSSISYFGNLSRANEQVNQRIETSSAIASALEIQLPVNGASNRLGLTNGTFGNELAFGVSYARVQGRLDVGLAYAQGDGGRNAGKVSVGFSW